MPAKTKASTKREELLDIASELFYRQGFGATGVKQIIDVAGIAKGTFYSHFESKEEVGVEWLKKRHAIWNDWLKAKLEDAKNPKAKVLAIFEFLESWMSESNFRGCAFLNTLAEIPDGEHPMRREIAAHKKGLQELMQSLAAEHFVGKTSSFVRQKGTVLFLLFEGSLIEAENFRDAWPIAAARKEVRTLLSTNG